MLTALPLGRRRQALHADSLTVLLVTSHEASRRRMRSLCSSTPGIEIVEQDPGGDQVPYAGDRQIDVILIDLDGAESPLLLVDTLSALHHGARLVVWADDISCFDEAFAAGVDAWITRSSVSATFASAIGLRPLPRAHP